MEIRRSSGDDRGPTEKNRMSPPRWIPALIMLTLCQFGVKVVSAQTTPGAPAAQSGTINPKLPTLFVVGDSTANNNANGGRGWGDPFMAYFDPTKINVLNRARGGRSSRTYLTEGLWDKVMADVKPGDTVLIQFGHNDAGAVNDDSRARGSLPGTGDATQEIDN
ncbi:MAG: hypothetical protein QOH96_3850, partial [Blastocatellia bacterium]|nr:hypothetical protein [Blastocatellia bacterium]